MLKDQIGAQRLSAISAAWADDWVADMKAAPRPLAPGTTPEAKQAALQTLMAPPAPPKPSEQMGLNPSAGPLSAAAVTAVDSDATPSMQAAAQATAQQEQDTQEQQQSESKLKSSGWAMNEFPFGDYPMVASFDDKEQPLFMFQSGNEFDVLDANEKVVARGNSFEEAAGKAKLYTSGLKKATERAASPAPAPVAATPIATPAAQPSTTGVLDGTQAPQAQQTETQRQEAPAAGVNPGETPALPRPKPEITPPKAGNNPAQTAQDVPLTNEGKTDAEPDKPFTMDELGAMFDEAEPESM